MMHILRSAGAVGYLFY